MKRSTKLMMGSSLLLTYTAFAGWMFCMAIVQNEYSAMHLDIHWLALLALSIYYVNFFLSSRGINLSFYIALQLAFFALAVFVFTKCAHLTPDRTGTRILDGILYAVVVVISAYAAVEPIKQHTVVMCFDFQITMLAVLLLLQNFLVLPAMPQAAVMCLAALVLTLAALIAARIDKEGSAGAVHGNPASGRLLIGLVFFLVSAVTALIAAFAFGGVRSLSEACLAVLNAIVHGIKTIILFIGGLLERFMLWLAARIPAQEGELLPAEQAAQTAQTAGDESLTELPPYVLYALCALAVVGIIFLLIRLCRHHITVKAPAYRRKSRVRRENGLGRALKALCLRIWRELQYRFFRLRFRRTPAGLLAYCEHRAKKEFPRGQSESGEHYLLRLSGLDFSPELCAALSALAGLVELSFYSRTAPTVPQPLYRTIHRAKFRLQKSVDFIPAATELG